MGHELAQSVRQLPSDSRYSRNGIRRLECDAGEQARKESVASAAVRGLCIQYRLPRGARSRVYVVGPGSDGARNEAPAKRRLLALPRLDHSDLSPFGNGGA